MPSTLFFLCGSSLILAQTTPGRLSVAAPSPTVATTNSLAASNGQPVTNPPKIPPSPSEAKSDGGPPPAPTGSGPTTNNTAPLINPEGSNLMDAPLPEIANQPKVITPNQIPTADGPKGPRDGRWYVAAGAGAMVQQIISGGTSTAVGQYPLNQTDSGNLGFYAAGKVGYDFAVRDVQLAFGGPTPMRTAMELEFNYLGSYEKIPLQNGSRSAGNETYNLSAYSCILNGLVKFEELPITPYFGGGVGVSTLYSYNHKIKANDPTTGSSYETAVVNANNVCLALQAIVGLERRIYENLSLYLEYKFMAYMDVQFSYGNQTTWNTGTAPAGQSDYGGSSSSNNFMAQQIVSTGLKWSF